MKAKFNLMTDSTCDFSIEDVRRSGITYLPFTYTEDGKGDNALSGQDDLFQSISAHDFYERIRWGATPKTSQPSQLVYEEAFRKAAELDVPTVLLTISSGISGGYNGAVTALDRVQEELGRDLPIYVVDTLLSSTSFYLLLEEGVRQRDKGLTAEEFVRWVEDARYHVWTIFMVDNLDTLHRGGRIPKTVALVSSALDAKPLLSWKLNGELTILGVTRGRKKGMRKMCEYYEKHRSQLQYPAVAAIGNADCENDGLRLGAMIADIDDSARILTSTIGPTIGCHVGPGMLSCCFWGGDRRERKNALTGKVKGVRQG